MFAPSLLHTAVRTMQCNPNGVNEDFVAAVVLKNETFFFVFVTEKFFSFCTHHHAEGAIAFEALADCRLHDRPPPLAISVILKWETPSNGFAAPEIQEHLLEAAKQKM